LNSILIACRAKDSKVIDKNDQPEKGFVSGRVLDTKSKPIAGAKVYVDNTIFYNSGISTATNADGYYRVQVPQGSWRVYAEINITDTQCECRMKMCIAS